MKSIKMLDDIKTLADARQYIKPRANSSNYFALEYLEKNENNFVSVAAVQDYCNERRKAIREDKKGYGDPSRSFEILRKDRLQLMWEEKMEGKCKYVKFNPEVRRQASKAVIEANNPRSDGFSSEMKQIILNRANHRCEITRVPLDESQLAIDHWNPKQGGGESKPENGVVMIKHLNEQKNNTSPVQWFCESVLTNFCNLCRRCGMDMQSVGYGIIDFLIVFLKDDGLTMQRYTRVESEQHSQSEHNETNANPQTCNPSETQ